MAADRRFKILAAADGFGQPLKDVVVAHLRTNPAVADVLDLGVDKYYAAAASVASNVVKTSSSDTEHALETHGVVVCGTGAGVAIFANKYPGVYATHCAVPAAEQAVPGEEARASECSVSGVPAGGGGKEEEGTGVPDGATPVRGWHRRGGGHSDEGALVRGRPGQCGTYSLGADIAGERECRGSDEALADGGGGGEGGEGRPRGARPAVEAAGDHLAAAAGSAPRGIHRPRSMSSPSTSTLHV
ncbi:hypothetical protein ABZP36_023613 [Zizania latifolia]